jgi:rod shape-determining protein MreB
MFKFLSNLFNNEISIDLGTANTLIYVKGKGIVLNEPTVVAVRHDKESKHGYVVAVGKEAKKMIGRTPYTIETIRPMKDGVIADVDYTEKMLKYFLKTVHGRGLFTPDPKILISVPGKASKVERQAIKRAAENAGATEVYGCGTWCRSSCGRGYRIYGCGYRRRHYRYSDYFSERSGICAVR